MHRMAEVVDTINSDIRLTSHTVFHVLYSIEVLDIGRSPGLFQCLSSRTSPPVSALGSDCEILVLAADDDAIVSCCILRQEM